MGFFFLITTLPGCSYFWGSNWGNDLSVLSTNVDIVVAKIWSLVNDLLRMNVKHVSV